MASFELLPTTPDSPNLLLISKATASILSTAKDVEDRAKADSKRITAGNTWVSGILLGIALQRADPDTARTVHDEVHQLSKDAGSEITGMGRLVKMILEQEGK